MIHPLAEDFSKLKDSEIDTRIQELSKKYWQSRNPAVQNQISLFLDLKRLVQVIQPQQNHLCLHILSSKFKF